MKPFRRNLAVTLAPLGLLVASCLSSCSGAPTSAAVAPAPESAEPQPAAAPPAEPEPEPAEPTPPRLTESESTRLLANVGFDRPYGVLVDREHDVYLVSNLAGDPFSAEGKGFISRVRPDGTVEARFIEGGKKGAVLNAPKGMAVTHDTLVVADLDVLRLFDRRTGAPRGRLQVSGASRLDAVALGTDNKTLYVTDRGDGTSSPGGAVYRIVDGKVTKLASGEALGTPAGLSPASGGTWVIGFDSGELYWLSNGGKRERAQRLADKGLSGIAQAGDGALLVSNHLTGEVLQGRPPAEFERLLQGIARPGQIGFDKKRNRVVVPAFEDSLLVLHVR